MTKKWGNEIMTKEKMTAIIFITALLFPLLCSVFMTAKMVCVLAFNDEMCPSMSEIKACVTKMNLHPAKIVSKNNLRTLRNFMEEKKIDSMATDLLYCKSVCVGYNGFLLRCMGKNFIPDAKPSFNIYRMNNGYLSWCMEETTTKPSVEKMRILKDFLDKRDIPLLFVQIPSKCSKYDNRLPVGVRDFSNLWADDLLHELGQTGIPCVDLRQEMYDDGIDQYSLYFRTDHHWRTEGGFWAFQNIATLLRQQYGFQFSSDILLNKNYKTAVYKKMLLGSQGIRVGSHYAGKDDFSLITPDFPTDFTVLYDNQEEARTGSFDDVFLCKDYLRGSNLSSNATLTYCGRDTGEVVITNHLSGNDKKIVQLRDSYSRSLSPFLAQTCSQLSVIDLRYYRARTFLDYIDQNKPDLVLITLCPDICDMTLSFDEIPGKVYKK